MLQYCGLQLVCSISQLSISLSLSQVLVLVTVHYYPDLFQSATFSFRTQNLTVHKSLLSADSKIFGVTVHKLLDFLADIFFHSNKSGLKNIWIRCRIRRMHVNGSRFRKENLRIQKYPDTCRRGPAQFWYHQFRILQSKGLLKRHA